MYVKMIASLKSKVIKTELIKFPTTESKSVMLRKVTLRRNRQIKLLFPVSLHFTATVCATIFILITVKHVEAILIPLTQSHVSYVTCTIHYGDKSLLLIIIIVACCLAHISITH